MTRSIFPLALLFSVVVIVAAAQQPPGTFRAEVNYIEVDAIVTDRDGNFVSGLPQDAFEILEDGEPQEIRAFSVVELPRAPAGIAPGQPAPVDLWAEPDVRTNRRTLEGRIYVLVLDDLHTSAASSMAVRTAARRFVDEYVGSADVVAVLYTSGRQDAMQGFTSSRALLSEAAGKFLGQKVRSATIERAERAEQRLQNPVRPDDVYRLDQMTDPLEQQRASVAGRLLGTLQRASSLLTGVRGRRKALILFSEGIDYDVRQVMAAPNASVLMAETRRVLSAATRGNVAIYAIDPRGLTGAANDADMELQAPIVEDPSLSLDARGFAEERRLGQQSLRGLADETGGRAFVDANDLSSAFDRIVQDNSSYYLLGYEPSDSRRDGRLRRIEVRLKDRPDLEVRARQAYVASDTEPPRARATEGSGSSPELRGALEQPLPVPGVGIAISAAAFDEGTPKASIVVALRIGPDGLRFDRRDGKYTGAFELGLVAVDSGGAILAGDHQELDMDLGSQNHDVVTRQGFQVLRRLALGPGRYELRAAVRESGSGALGSVQYNLEVPDFSKNPLAMSGLVITSAEATLAIPTAQSDERLGRVLPGPPTTLREFAPEDELALYMEIYDNAPSRPHKVEVVTRVHASDGREVLAFRNEWDTAKLGGKPGGFGYAPRVPLKGVEPGDYVLRVEAAVVGGKGGSVVRELAFRVRGAALG